MHESFDLRLEEPTNPSGSYRDSGRNCLSLNVRSIEKNARNLIAGCVRASKIAVLKVVRDNKYPPRSSCEKRKNHNAIKYLDITYQGNFIVSKTFRTIVSDCEYEFMRLEPYVFCLLVCFVY